MTRTRNHIVRSQTCRFVDYENAIHASHFRRKRSNHKDDLDLYNPLCLCVFAGEILFQLMEPDELRRQTFERAVKLLAAKPRSVAELRERLLRGKNTNEEVVETVIARLREYGYLNDERFAFSYASYKVKQKPVGRRRLERDLKFKKVDSGVANEALEMVFTETPEEQLIDPGHRQTAAHPRQAEEPGGSQKPVRSFAAAGVCV